MRHPLFRPIAGLFVFCMVVGGGYAVWSLWVSHHAGQGEGASEQKAPSFALPDASGNTITLESVQGEIKLVNFWASWSPYAREELKVLARIKENYGGRVEVVALNRDKVPAEGKEFLRSIGLEDELLFVYDEGDTYYKQVGGYAMPETVFIGPDGEMREHVRVPLSYEEASARLDALLP